MKKLILILAMITGVGCEMPKHKHLLRENKVHGQEYYVTSEIILHDGCAIFTCLDPWDLKGEVQKTVCGSFTIEY